jgi:nucleoside-diphosphate-sugar epimerase
MKNVILTGATGMVGRHVLEECLTNPEISKVTSILRRPSGITHEKLSEVVITDFMDYSNIEDHFKNQNIAIYCLAAYAGKVKREEYKKITVDYTRSFAEVLKKNSTGTTFCLFSASGADSKETSRMMFARVKGAAENVVLRQQFPQTYIFRPGYIYPVIKRKEPHFTFYIVRWLYPILKRVFPDAVITSVQLAKALVSTGIYGGNQTIFENKDIKRMFIKK